MTYRERLVRTIPGGAHTYSRGHDQFPANAPEILVRGKGAYVYDPDERRFLDYGMSLRAVNIGYAEDRINQAALRQIENGNNLTRPSMIELEAAELLVELIDSVEMVKFTKNGSTATTAAVKLARAYTGRELVARCAEHPFFSYDDWFIASTPITRGIPADTVAKTKTFAYNDLPGLERLLAEHSGEVACLILEPASAEEPRDGYLQKAKALCEQHGVIFILDELITGFRWHLKGAQHYYDVQPDLCTFGKAMANGFSVAAVAGRREIMELGGIDSIGQERVFFLSTTHGAEMSGLGAFVETVHMLREHRVVDHLWEYGRELIDMLNETARSCGVAESFSADGVACSPYYVTRDLDGEVSPGLRTLFVQEMIEQGVLIPWIALSYRHGTEELEITRRAAEQAFRRYRKALEDGHERHLIGSAIKPVFRQYN